MCISSSTPVMVLDVRELFFKFQGFGNFRNYFVITYLSCFQYPFANWDHGSEDRASFESVQCIMYFALFLSSLTGFLDAKCGFQSTSSSFRSFYRGIFILNTCLIWKKKICTNGMFSCLQNGIFQFEFPKNFIAL